MPSNLEKTKKFDTTYIPRALFRHEFLCCCCEFNVDESTVYLSTVSLKRNTHKTRLCDDQLIKM